MTTTTSDLSTTCIVRIIMMRVCGCAFLMVACTASALASTFDDRSLTIDAAPNKPQKVETDQAGDDYENLNDVLAAAMASSSSGLDIINNPDKRLHNSEFDIEPQPTRAPTEAPAVESDSTSQSDSLNTSSAPPTSPSEPNVSFGNIVSTVAPRSLAIISAVIFYAL